MQGQRTGHTLLFLSTAATDLLSGNRQDQGKSGGVGAIAVGANGLMVYGLWPQ